jgi:hypothetical protein
VAEETLEAVLASQPQWAINHVARVELLWPHLEGVGLDLDRLRNVTTPVCLLGTALAWRWRGGGSGCVPGGPDAGC